VGWCRCGERVIGLECAREDVVKVVLWYTRAIKRVVRCRVRVSSLWKLPAVTGKWFTRRIEDAYGIPSCVCVLELNASESQKFGVCDER
jgi:hypothetical protein